MEEQKIIQNNENRKMIYNHIMAHPGVAFVVLRRVFDLNKSTLRYHLNYLEKNQKITFSMEVELASTIQTQITVMRSITQRIPDPVVHIN